LARKAIREDRVRLGGSVTIDITRSRDPVDPDATFARTNS
jgi:hypothetical protein